MMIPKIIHYCWFGGNALPDLAVKCIESWKKYCPDYEIKCWDETNFDYKCCDYVREAYAAEKWAFVSDYARFAILHKYGGIYFDTDVELIRAIDTIVEKGPFMGCEAGKKRLVAPGLGLGAPAGMGLYKEILDYYGQQKFLRSDGTADLETVVTKVSGILKKYGFRGDGSIEQAAGINIYPPEYFCPKDYYTGKLTVTKKTYSIHHYGASWYEPEEEKEYLLKQRLNCMLGMRWGQCLGKPVHYYYRFKLRVRQKGIVSAVKYFIAKMFFCFK